MKVKNLEFVEPCIHPSSADKLWAKVWPSSLVLIDLVIQDATEWAPEPKLVLELGCGMGISSIFAALHFPRAKVIGIDMNVEGIRAADRNRRCNYPDLDLQFSLFNWNSDPSTLWVRNVDLIIASDVLYMSVSHLSSQLLEKLFAHC